jgi:hypothetical protein
MLYETALYIQQTDFSNAEEVAQLLAQIKTVIELFDKHAHSEDTLVFAAIEQYEPDVVKMFEEEHVTDHALGEKLDNLLKAFPNTFSIDNSIYIGNLLNQAFIEFMVFNLQHMAKEEDIINKLLWQYYSDEQLHSITQSILANIPPPQMAQYSKWMIRGLSNNEITGWLTEVKNNAPDFVFQSLIQTAEQELSTSRLQMVKEAITEGAMLA